MLGATVLGLFLAFLALQAGIAFLFGHGLQLLGMLAGYGLLWWATSRLRQAPVRVFCRALAAGILFTPSLPTPSAEWSSPWPPAAFWVAIQWFHGQKVGWPLILVLASSALLWLAGWGMSLGKQREPMDRL